MGAKGYETLHAIYHKSLLPIIQKQLMENNNKIKEIFPYSKILTIPSKIIGKYAEEDRIFKNINTITELNESFS
jgi:molybdopterin-guanine dinucleotide biosynthesis protein A